MGIHSDDNAQGSLDFLTAISIFLLTMAYLVLQIPAIFAPFESQSADLQPVAYRTCMILAEDTGWWRNESTNQSGADWENAPLNDVCRIGLAANKHNPNDFSKLMNRGKICILSENKIKELNRTYNSNRIIDHSNKSYTMHSWIRYLLGLDIIRTYSYNISLQYLNGTTAHPIYVPNNTHPALCIGNQVPETAEIEKMERLVAIEGDCGVGYLNIGDTNTSNITMGLPHLDSFTVKFENFSEKNRTADARLNVILNNTDYNNVSVINESGLFAGGWHTFNRTVIDDYLCDSNNITVNVSWCNVSYMWVNRSDWGDRIGGMSMPSAKLVVCIW
ncbi:MAG: hypothetical protein J7J03_04035 [Methanosarcinales archaeon]|nr:hypothetical protein [Methanosarcinales archaeon]